MVRAHIALFAALAAACDGPVVPHDAGGRMDASWADSGEPCARDLDCPGTYCDPQRCLPGDPRADPRGCTPSVAPCAAGETCDEASRSCVPGTCAGEPDVDGDGHDSIACGGDDCADDDETRFPGNGEVCDAARHDEDCLADTVGHVDADMDGFVGATCCNGDVCGPDCDDTSASVRPDVLELCNGRDDDCDSMTDEERAGPICPGGVCSAGTCRLSPWDHTFGEPAMAPRTSLAAMDALANVYVMSSFTGTAAFDGGPFVARPTGARNGAVVAYAADGTHRWDRHVAGDLDDQLAMSLSRDGASVYVAGGFFDEVDLGDGVAASAVGPAVFVAELDAADGHPTRVEAIPLRLGRIVAVAPSASGLRVLGLAQERTTIAGASVLGGFVADLSVSLAVTSARALTGVLDVRGMVSLPGGGHAIVGEGFGVVDLGCAPAGAPDSGSFFVAAFDGSGTCRWLYWLPVEGFDTWDIASGPDGSVFASGEFGGPIDFGGGARTPVGGTNGVIIALDSSGSYAWDRVFDTPEGGLYGIGVAADSVRAVGWFRDRIRIGGSTLAGSADGDSIFVELSPLGAVRRTQTFLSDDSDRAVDIAVGLGDSTVIVGGFQGRLTLGTGTFLGPATYVTRLGS